MSNLNSAVTKLSATSDTSLQALADDIRLQRAQEIESFVCAQTSADQRAKFVAELKLDAALRLATSDVRAQVPSNLIHVSENASKLFRDGNSFFRSGNMFFPGDPYIAGIENRPDIRGQRNDAYNEAILHFESLIAAGELEDLAIENIDRVNSNIIAGNQAHSKFGASSDLSSIAGMLYATTVRGQPDVLHRLNPQELQVGSPDFSSVNHESPIADRAEALVYNLHNCIDRSDEYTDAKTAAILPEEFASLNELISTQPAAREVFLKFFEAPFSWPNSRNERDAKLVAYRVLSDYASTHNDAEVCDRMTQKMDQLIDQLTQEEMHDTVKYYIRDVLDLFAAKANQSDMFWEKLKPLLAHRLENDIFGQKLDSKTSVSNGDLLDSLDAAPLRVSGDPEVKTWILRAANFRAPADQTESNYRISSAVESIHRAAIWISRHLSVQIYAPLCFEAIFRKGLGNAADLARAVLAKTPLENLQEVRLDGRAFRRAALTTFRPSKFTREYYPQEYESQAKDILRDLKLLKEDMSVFDLLSASMVLRADGRLKAAGSYVSRDNELALFKKLGEERLQQEVIGLFDREDVGQSDISSLLESAKKESWKWLAPSIARYQAEGKLRWNEEREALDFLRAFGDFETVVTDATIVAVNSGKRKVDVQLINFVSSNFSDIRANKIYENVIADPEHFGNDTKEAVLQAIKQPGVAKHASELLLGLIVQTAKGNAREHREETEQVRDAINGFLSIKQHGVAQATINYNLLRKVIADEQIQDPRSAGVKIANEEMRKFSEEKRNLKNDNKYISALKKLLGKKD